MGDIIQFLPRANPNADRAFWKGPHRQAILEAEKQAILEITNVALVDDTAPCEYVAPEKDPA